MWHIEILKIQQEEQLLREAFKGRDKVLRDKAFNIAKNPKYDRYQRGLASMVYNFFDKTSSGSGFNMHVNNGKLAEELHKLILKKFIQDLKTIFGVLIQLICN